MTMDAYAEMLEGALHAILDQLTEDERSGLISRDLLRMAGNARIVLASVIREEAK